MNWHTLPPEEKRTFVRQWAEVDGLNSRQIAEKFTHGAVTRDMVLGFCRRAKISLNVRSPAPPRPTVEARPRERAPLMDHYPDKPPLAGSTPTPLVDTTGCKWPVIGGFCNNPIHAKSYCPTHFAKAYRSAPDDLLNKLPFSTKNPKIQSAMHFYIKEGLVSYRKLVNGAYRYSMKTPPV